MRPRCLSAGGCFFFPSGNDPFAFASAVLGIVRRADRHPMTDAPCYKTASGRPLKGARRPSGACTPLDARVVCLDVGGRQFKTYASTLRACPDGMLARLLDGGFDTPETHDGCLFVDRDPQYFAHILAYLRCVAGGGAASLPLPGSADALEGIADEADYFGLSSLGDDIRRRLAAQERAAQKAAAERAVAPPPPSPDRASVRISIARGGQRAALRAQGAKPWDERRDRALSTINVAFRQRIERCDHEYDLPDRWSWRCIVSDGAAHATRFERDAFEVAACRGCSAIDTAALVDAAVDAMATAEYALHSIKQFPKTAEPEHSLMIYLVFERARNE